MARVLTTIFAALLLMGWSHGYALSLPADTTQADTTAPDSVRKRNLRVIALPLVFYTPDTRWGFGGSGLFTFSLGRDTSTASRSMVLPGAVYTTMRQFLSYTLYQLFFGHRRYWLNGELGYFRYVYQYFGIGNQAPPGYLEKYDAVVGRLRLNALTRLRPGWYAGLHYALDIQRNTLRDSAGLLTLAPPTGALGGVMSSVGIALNHDSRDHLQSPSRGWLLKGELRADAPWTGSDFRCVRGSLTASRYLSPWPGHVVALNGVLSGSWGNPSFFQMSYLGGPERLRGYFEGQYRDMHAAALQAEYRSPYWWRLGGVAFLAAGTVWGSDPDWRWQDVRPNAGAGLRFRLDKQEKTSLRLDYGVGYRAQGFYLTFGEAF